MIVFFNKDSDKNAKLYNSDILPKVLSVVVAIILWFYVVDVQNTYEEKTVFNVPVVIENFEYASGLDIVSGKDYTIDVVVRGTKSDVTHVDQSDIYASVDMLGIDSAGNYKLDVSVACPKNLSVVNQTVSQINVGVDKTIAKSVHIVVNASYSIEEEFYEKGEEILSFDTVFISGPEKIIDSIKRVEARLDLDKLESKVTARVPLVPVDENGNEVSNPYIKLKDSAVTVSIPVYKIASKKIVANFYDVNYLYDYVIHPSELRVKGESTVVDNIDSIKTVPITEINPMLVVKSLEIPEGLSVFDNNGTPVDSVKVYIKSVKPIHEVAEND